MASRESTSTHLSAKAVWQRFPAAQEVTAVRRRDDATVVELRSQSHERRTITLSPFTYVHWRPEGPRSLSRCDYLEVVSDDEQPQCVSKILDDGRAGFVTCHVVPYYSRSVTLGLTRARRLHVQCHEITTREQHQAAIRLDQFHYRPTNLWGRSQTLTLVTDDPSYVSAPTVVGYITLNSPPLLSRPRDQIMGWDAAGRLSHIDRVVRIARVVVHPDYRGIGLGAMLVQQGIEYAREHWNAVGKKPWLLEVVAEMAKYHPVFERAGLLRIGNTVGRDIALYTPADRLDSTQSAGHWRSSLDRMKARTSSPKPYFAAGLDAETSRLVDCVAAPERTCLRADAPPKLCAPVIRLDRVTLRRVPGSPVLSALTGATSVFLDIRNASPGAARDRLLAMDKRLNGGGALDQLCAARRRLVEVAPEIAKAASKHWREASQRLRALQTAIRELLQAADRIYEDIEALAALADRGFSQCRSLVASAQSALTLVSAAVDGGIGEVVDDRRTESQRWRDLSALRSALGDLSATLGLLEWSSRVSQITSAFGIPPDGMDYQDILTDLSLDIAPGAVVLVTGPSASGKTTLLDALAGRGDPSSGSVEPPTLSGLVETLDLEFAAGVPIIDLVGTDTAEACELLNAAGISEAKVYAKTREQLSHGQRYRVAAALLAASGKPVWIADEFCAFLDPLTALVVARGLARMARRRGATLIAATADSHKVEPGLQPDLLLRLSLGQTCDPSPQIIHWGSAEDWRRHVRVGADASRRLQPWGARGAAGASCGADIELPCAEEWLWRNDLIYHRMRTTWDLSGGTASAAELSADVEASLRDHIGDRWTPRTLRLQVQMRAKLFTH